MSLLSHFLKKRSPPSIHHLIQRLQPPNITTITINPDNNNNNNHINNDKLNINKFLTWVSTIVIGSGIVLAGFVLSDYNPIKPLLSFSEGLTTTVDLVFVDDRPIKNSRFLFGGVGQVDANFFPDVDSTWKAFNEIQKLLSKNHGKVIGDFNLMTHAPLVVRKTNNLGDAARLFLETKYHRLPVVDGDGRLVCGVSLSDHVVEIIFHVFVTNRDGTVLLTYRSPNSSLD